MQEHNKNSDKIKGWIEQLIIGVVSGVIAGLITELITK